MGKVPSRSAEMLKEISRQVVTSSVEVRVHERREFLIPPDFLPLLSAEREEYFTATLTAPSSLHLLPGSNTMGTWGNCCSNGP